MYFLTNFSVWMLFSCALFCQEIIDLGETDMKGKREQPEAMTFLSRADMPSVDPTTYKLNFKDRILESLKENMFKAIIN